MFKGLRLFTLTMILASALAGQQSSFTDTGGSVTLGSDFTITGASLANPPGTFSFDCPATALPPGQYQAEWVCNGGTISVLSNDGLTSVSGTVTAGTLIETASGGGRGGHTTYYYSFSGTFFGTMTLNGQTQAVRGVTSQSLAGLSTPLGTGTIATGVTSVNSDYEPLYITDTYNARVVQVDNMNGDNWVALGSAGSGVKQFNLPWGIAVDAAGKIYVTDSGNCRVTRMDNMSGANWRTLGTCGSGTLQFNNPQGLVIGPTGRIYVADSGNNRIVEVSDIAGDNWTVFGVAGSGTGQFNQPGGISLDSTGKIYIADTGNARIVRMDNMGGSNWIALGSGGAGVNQFSGPYSISLDSAAKIYVADTYNDRIVRMDDMLGTNWTVLGGSLYPFINPYGVSVDAFGTIYIADSRDYRLALADDITGTGFTTYGTGGIGVGQFDSPTTMVAVPAKAPTAVPLLTSTHLTYSNTVVGTGSAAQMVTMTNIGSSPLEINSITPTSDFSVTTTCGGSLPVGQSCSISVIFAPITTGTRTGSIAIDCGSAGVKKIGAGGVGTLVALSTTALNFGNVNAGVGGTSMTVTVSNPGAASAGIASITLKAPNVYRLKNACPASLAAGTSCTLTVKFYPQAAAIYNGVLSITDAAGVLQKVSITGTGVSN